MSPQQPHDQSNLIVAMADLIRREADALRADTREDIQNMREDLGKRIDDVGSVVREQNSRISKGEAHHTDLSRRVTAIETAWNFPSPLPHQKPEQEDFAGKDPVTGRDLKVLAWGASAAVTVGGFLWGVLKWIAQAKP